MEKVYRVITNWLDDLIWCPSQCYLEIEYKGRQFVIYLRWRGCDPWTCDLIECPPDLRFDMHSDDFEWIRIGVKFWETTQLNELKEEAENLVNQWLIENVK